MKTGVAILATALAVSVQAKDPDVLSYGSPESAGMLSKPLRDMVANLTAFTRRGDYGGFNEDNKPIEPGGTTLVARNGIVVSRFGFGKRDLYGAFNATTNVATELPPEEQEDASIDTIYDMASLTKLFTSVAALQQIDKGTISLYSTVASYVPAFAVNGKDNVTIEQLVTHTSGFPPDPSPPLYNLTVYPTYESRIEAILNAPLENAPGAAFVYSDLNFMSLMIVIETVAGKPLDQLIYDFTVPMGMLSTFFNRGNVEGPAFPFYPRMATEEFQIAVLGPGEPQRPQPVRGTVHDENAWALDGVSGHAGLFSTVDDTAKFCQMILNNGTYNGRRILSQDAVDMIFHNYNTKFPSDSHGVGFELDQYYTAGPMANPRAASHTGFTGTTLVVDRASNTLFLHFSNRVHPSRDWSSNNIVREAVGYWVAKALGRDVAFPSY